MEIDACIALGTNQGDREINLLRAVAELGRIPGGRVTGLSRFYETTPVGVTSSMNFYNAVLKYSTTFSPRELLSVLLRIENDVFGRIRPVADGSRSMDMDILLYGDAIIQEPDLIIPHPRMTERLFVLEPLCDIAADLVHPVVGKSMRHLRKTLTSNEVVKIV